MVRTLSFHFGGLGSFPGWGIKIPLATRQGKKKKKGKKERKKNRFIPGECQIHIFAEEHLGWEILLSCLENTVC